MAMDFPVSPVDRLPIFPDEACSAAALMELVSGPARVGVASRNGSRGAVVCGFGESSRARAAALRYEEASVAAGGAAISGFSESEGDNADAIEHCFSEAHRSGVQEVVFQDRANSSDGCSALLENLIPKPLIGQRG